MFYFILTHPVVMTDTWRVVQTVLNRSLRQSCSVITNVTSALEVSLNDMRYINSRLTYLLTYLHELLQGTLWLLLLLLLWWDHQAVPTRGGSCPTALTLIPRPTAPLLTTAFAAAGPGLWNSLPPHLRDADLPYSRFRQSLKTFLFG